MAASGAGVEGISAAVALQRKYARPQLIVMALSGFHSPIVCRRVNSRRALCSGRSEYAYWGLFVGVLWRAAQLGNLGLLPTGGCVLGPPIIFRSRRELSAFSNSNLS